MAEENLKEIAEPQISENTPIIPAIKLEITPKLIYRVLILMIVGAFSLGVTFMSKGIELGTQLNSIEAKAENLGSDITELKKSNSSYIEKFHTLESHINNKYHDLEMAIEKKKDRD